MPASSSLPILTFHALDDQPSVISFSPDVFERGIAMLRARGFRAIDLIEGAERLRRGAALPERSFAITFDDGYQSVYDVGFPILERYGMIATVFLIAGDAPPIDSDARLPSLNGRAMLSWREIREMQRAEFRFGAHTLTHPDLTRLPHAQAQREILESKARVEDALGAQVTCFAYPFGRHDQRSREIVSRNFVCACTDALGIADAHSDPYALERIDTFYLRMDRLFGIIATRAFAPYVRARSILRRMRRLSI